ncbi:MAG: universal stress protein [Chloroflexota bacterium]
MMDVITGQSAPTLTFDTSAGRRPDAIWQLEDQPEMDTPALRFLACPANPRQAEELLAYTHYLGNTLAADLRFFWPSGSTRATLAALFQEAQLNSDLVILGEPEQSLLERLVQGTAAFQAVDHASTSLLLVRRPRWPLRKLLLVARGTAADETAVSWVMRLARPAHASVTVLALLPPVPALYSPEAHLQQSLALLATPAMSLGRELAAMAQHLQASGIPSTLHLRQGTPAWQVGCELVEGDYDLIALAAGPVGWWRRWLHSDVLGPLVRLANRPLLIVKREA